MYTILSRHWYLFRVEAPATDHLQDSVPNLLVASTSTDFILVASTFY